MSRIIAVTGATGYIGRYLLDELHRQQVSVRALVRPISSLDGFNGPVEWVEGDMRNSEALRTLVQGASAVVHLAYEHSPGRYRGGEGVDLSSWIEANVNGSLRLIVEARDAGVRQFIFLSSRAVFSRTEPGRELNETHPVSPDTHYGAYKVAVEAFLQSFARVEGMRTCAIRSTGVYGLSWPPERSKWWGLITAVLRNEPVKTSSGGTEVHGSDVARVIWEVIERRDLPLDIVHVSDLYVTHRDVVRLARQFSGRTGSLPLPPTAPLTNPLVCGRLEDLDIKLGGILLLEETISHMVHTAMKQLY